MVDNRFNKILTIIIVISLIGLFIVMGFWGYDIFQKYYIRNGAEDAVDEFDKKLNEINEQNIDENNTTTTDENKNSNTNNLNGNTKSNSAKTSTKKVQMKYRGFDVAGKIEIPKTKLKYPVLSVATLSSMKVSIGIIYGPGLNQVGNTVLMGHNYRNGALFSNNSKLNIGDYVYITDMTGKKIRYVIYNKYITATTDFDYAIRNTGGRREISMASCTDDSKSRLIIWAKEG